jgi:hypothetical protein
MAYEDCRYALTLEAMKKDENFLWMQLSKCRITDRRTRKVRTTFSHLSLTLLR